jgi:uncharacterized protein (DUF1697 family)
MPTHVALLRGINVGRANRIAMADLRSVVTGLGHSEVATYLQSGNVVLAPTGEVAPPALAGQLRDAIEQTLGVSCHVVVLTADEWRAVVAANPYRDQAVSDPTTVHAAVQQDDLTTVEEETLARLLAEAEADGSQDHLTVVGRTTYLCTPGGLGRSKLAERLARTRRTGQDRATARNWRTVEALADLLQG